MRRVHGGHGSDVAAIRLWQIHSTSFHFPSAPFFLPAPPCRRLALTFLLADCLLQYLILSVFLASTWFKYVLLVLDARWEARGQHWAAKTTWSVKFMMPRSEFAYAPLPSDQLPGFFTNLVFSFILFFACCFLSRMFYLELCADLLRLFLYLIFFAIVCAHYGLPLHLIRELGIALYNLRERIVKFIHFRNLTRNMNERFADATEEELARADRTCIVCREEMEVGATKKLPCGHLFHFACLRTWLERSQSCPTCRHQIPDNAPAPQAAAAAAAQNNQANAGGAAQAPGAGAAAAAAAPPAAAAAAEAPGGGGAAADGLQLPPLPPGLPALPPHLQAHLDALRLATAQARQEFNARREGATSGVGTGSSTGAAPLPASPLHPLFGSTPVPPQPSPSPSLLHFPSPNNHLQPPLAHASNFHSFMSPFHAAAAQHPQHSPLLGAPVHAPPSFVFPPPPPPPPPAHMFPLSPPSPSVASIFQPPLTLPLSGGAGSLAALAPGDPLFGAYLGHHIEFLTQSLQHHIQFLSSSLHQARILADHHRDIERRLKEQQSAAQGEGSASRSAAQPSPATVTAEGAGEGAEDKKEPTDSTLTQRKSRPHQQQ